MIKFNKKYLPAAIGLLTCVFAVNNVSAASLCSNHVDYSISKASSDDYYKANRAPNRSIDGNLSNWSRWTSYGRNRSIEYDLGQNRDIDQVQIAFYKANDRTHYFEVQSSTDSKNWKTVGSDMTSVGANGLVAYDLLSSNARYLKIIGKGTSRNAWNAIIETNIIGCASTSGDSPSESIAEIKRYFDLEGGDNDLNPYQSDNTLEFDALKAAHTTPNGNGWRHELKMAIENRRDMDQTSEEFSATITPVLSTGAKTIVFQYHGSGSPSTLLKVYVSDVYEDDHDDSKASNGIFDVYVRFRKDSDDGEETMINFGTMRSGQSFDLSMRNDDGKVYLKVMNTDFEHVLLNSDDSYLKFGNYLQAQYPEDNSRADDFEDFYDEVGITKSVVTFSNVYYDRN